MQHQHHNSPQTQPELEHLHQRIRLLEEEVATYALQCQLATSLQQTHDLGEALQLVLETTFRLDIIDCGCIYLVDPTSGDLDLVAHSGLSPDFIKQAWYFPVQSPQAQLAHRGQSVYSRSPEEIMPGSKLCTTEGLEALTMLPIYASGKIIAALFLCSHTPHEISPSVQTAFQAIASQVGATIARVQTEKALRKSQALLATVDRTLHVVS